MLTPQPVVPASAPIENYTYEQWTSTTTALMNNSLPRSRQMTERVPPEKLVAPYTGRNQLKVDVGDLVFSYGPKSPMKTRAMCTSAFSSWNGVDLPDEHEKYMHYLVRGIAGSEFDFAEGSGSTTGVTVVARGGLNHLNSCGKTMHAGEVLVWDIKRTGSESEMSGYFNGIKRRRVNKRKGSVKAFLRPVSPTDFGEHLRSGIVHLMRQLKNEKPLPRPAQLVSEQYRAMMDAEDYWSLASVITPVSVIAFSALIAAYDMGYIDFVPGDQRVGKRGRAIGGLARELAVWLGIAAEDGERRFESGLVENILKRVYFQHASSILPERMVDNDRMNPQRFLSELPAAYSLLLTFPKLFTDAMADRSATFVRGVVGEAGETIQNGSVGTIIL